MKNYTKNPYRVLIENAKKIITLFVDRRCDSSAWLYTNDKNVMKKIEPSAKRWNFIYYANRFVGVEYELSKDCIDIKSENGGDFIELL